MCNIDIPDDSEIAGLIANVIKEQSLKKSAYTKIGKSSKDGYLGVITRVCISYEDEFRNTKKLHVIIKSAPKFEYLRKEAPIHEEYNREIFMYTQIFPLFKSYQLEKLIKVPFRSTVKFYYATNEENKEALVLKNLQKIGYSMWDRTQPMDDVHLKLVLQEYGKFHALSLGLKHQKPAIYQNLAHNLNYLFEKNPEESFLYMSIKHQSKQALKAIDGCDAEIIAKFKNFLAESNIFMSETRFKENNYSVILHGDCWCNNIMFNYKIFENAKIPTKLCFLDFQMSAIGSPVLDISNFFYTCCSSEALENIEEYLLIYYNSLANHLTELQCNPNDLFPYNEFRLQWKTFAKFGLYLAVLILHGMLSDQNEIPDLTEHAKTGKSLGEAWVFESVNSEKYDSRIKSIILHFVKNDLI